MAIGTNKPTDPSGDLREQRLAAGLSQQRLAELSGVAINSVRLFERGYRPATSGALARVEAALLGDKPNEKRPAGEPGASTTLAGGAAAGARAA